MITLLNITLQKARDEHQRSSGIPSGIGSFVWLKPLLQAYLVGNNKQGTVMECGVCVCVCGWEVEVAVGERSNERNLRPHRGLT